MTLAQARRRAAKGARLLDRIFRSKQKWAHKINCKRLKMSNCGDCILGQLFGSYADGLERIGFYARGKVSQKVCTFGFAFFNPTSSQHDRAFAYDYLQEAWEDEVKSRRTTA